MPVAMESDTLSTGNRQIDMILRGGFPKNSINIIMGQPGTGKTIFAEQLVFFNAAHGDRPILYLTTLSEPISKVLTYLQRFSFYDEDKIGSIVHYREVGRNLIERGIEGFAQTIEEMILELSPRIIVIDSFRGLKDIANSQSEYRRMLFDMAGILSAFDTTVFLVGEYTELDYMESPEFAIADGIIQFSRKSETNKDERFLRVLKLRGSSYAEGLHGCSISNDGLSVYPRLVSPKHIESYSWKKERISCGIPDMDRLLDGGLWRGASTLVAGPTGSGKTTFSLMFALEAIKCKEKSLYVNFQENPTQLLRAIDTLGYSQEELRKGGMEFVYASPVELQIDSVVVTILRRLEEQKFSRVVIDAVGDLSMAASDGSRLHDYLYALSQTLAVQDVSSMLVYETACSNIESLAAEGSPRYSNMADNIILLSSGHHPTYERELRCVKARGCNHDRKAHPFDITQKGIEIRS